MFVVEDRETELLKNDTQKNTCNQFIVDILNITVPFVVVI